MAVPPFLDAEDVLSLLPWPAAIAALEGAVRGVPCDGPARMTVPASSGQVLLMPAVGARSAGVKLLGVAPGNGERGLPRIQGIFVLFDGETLTPTALIDGAALTALRTPAVSALAVGRLAPETAASLVVFGAGPQAEQHIRALRAIRPISSVRVVGRRDVSAFAARLSATAGTVDDVAEADIVVCATNACTPLFPAGLLRPDACVVAMGTHTPDCFEVGVDVFARADRVVVEDVSTSLREAGDVVAAIEAGTVDAGALIDYAHVVDLTPEPGISIVKTVGMAWEDLAIAEALVAAAQRP